jgi:uncharacterized protein GlcG (DUF336 family)
MVGLDFFMRGKTHAHRTCLLILLCVCVVALVAGFTSGEKAGAQASGPILISEDSSTRAVALDSVTRTREPFPLNSSIQWGTDKRTRVMLFALNLSLQPGETAGVVTADAEDGARRVHPLTVEYVGPVPEQPWATALVLRLGDGMEDLGDVLVRITYRGVSSNRVRVGIGHLGGGPPDDEGARPTPGSAVPVQPPVATAGTLNTDEVRQVISQAVAAAVELQRAVTVAVTDREGNVLGVFQMTGAPSTTMIRSVGPTGRGLEGTSVPSSLAAISKAGTGSLFSTTGNAFTTRTAGFIIQEHFPPNVAFRPSGPLYGVQFSSLPCSDIKTPGLPLGLSADPGGVPIYKNGVAVGGVGIEGDGVYGVDRDPSDFDQPFEEVIAASAVRGFEPPSPIRGNNILVDGIRLPYTNVERAPSPAAIQFASLPGTLLAPVRGAQASAFTPVMIAGVGGEVDVRFFPFIGGSSPMGSGALSTADVERIIAQAAQQASVTRAAIRYPLGSSARVTIAVVDAEGKVLGLFRTSDAPVFGFDVSVQKARTAALFSKSNAAALLRGAGFGSYVDRAASDGLALDGSVAYSDRAVGFLHRPFFPDGINDTAAGPFSTQINEWSVFNVGLQLDLIKANLLSGLAPCTSLPNVANGIQIFAGSVPLYKNGVLAGGIGISGDGIDQDDLIAAAGANGYAPPAGIRSDQVFVRGVRLPFLKFPRSPQN